MVGVVPMLTQVQCCDGAFELALPAGTYTVVAAVNSLSARTSVTVGDGFTLVLPIVIAIVVYILLHLAINGFLRIFAHRKTTV